MKKLLAIILALTVVVVAALAIGAFSISKDKNLNADKAKITTGQMDATVTDSYAIFKTNMGEFTVKLYGSKTPLTVKNFEQLVNKGFYTGLTFHRVISGFMIQGGDPQGNGTGGPGYTFPDEIKKDLHFDKPGLLAMANRGPNTNGSQFFITVAPATWLDNKYTIFGSVVKGYDIVEKISKVATNPKNDMPLEPVVIESIVIEKDLNDVSK